MGMTAEDTPHRTFTRPVRLVVKIIFPTIMELDSCGFTSNSTVRGRFIDGVQVIRAGSSSCLFQGTNLHFRGEIKFSGVEERTKALQVEGKSEEESGEREIINE